MADPHVYGSADDDNRQTSAANGFHGEGKAPLPDVAPENIRKTTVAGGGTVIVEETSGIAAAEAAGNTKTQGDAQETAGSG